MQPPKKQLLNSYFQLNTQYYKNNYKNMNAKENWPYHGHMPEITKELKLKLEVQGAASGEMGGNLLNSISRLRCSGIHIIFPLAYESMEDYGP